ncbi:Acetoin utilization protein AcuC [Pseudoruegeria aquimaris]|uniref:Acetoin utilization protein AcuC n=1 Tax=Pseudoruegeria aquimaris TaxID=393663 RepID=A0A1Y5TAL0_9RHOB|nr:acetoin utilization protein AcuC [Pseudoruegeria aquimaris]SLN57699.1 Acetoin utilization protein AcuC [Pseudoruegeria aquimaris]
MPDPAPRTPPTPPAPAPRAAAAPAFIGAEIFRRSSYGAHHPLRVPRVSTVMDLARALGMMPPGSFRLSPRAKPAALTRWHDAGYVAALARAEARQQVSEATRRRHGLGTPSNPVFAEMYRRPATAAGGSLLAAELIAGGGAAYNPAGGTHHGLPDRASGFCYLNDAVLAILRLRDLGVARVAYVDIDAHHGDGVALAFRDTPEVLCLSVHEEKRWPFTGALGVGGAGNLVDLPVEKGFNDSAFAFVLEELILPVVADFAADAIVLQCGADALLEDPLSRLALSNNAHADCVRALRPLAPRMLVLGGGGYNPWSVGRCWAGVWAALSGQALPERAPPQAEAILRGLHWSGHRLARNPPEHWFTTLRDAPRPGPIPPRLRADVAALRAAFRA